MGCSPPVRPFQIWESPDPLGGRGDTGGQAKKGGKTIPGRRNHTGNGLAGGKLWASWGEPDTWWEIRCLQGLECHTQERQGLPTTGALSHAAAHSHTSFQQSDRAAEEVGLKQGDGGDQPGACCSPPGPVWRCLSQAVDGGSNRSGEATLGRSGRSGGTQGTAGAPILGDGRTNTPDHFGSISHVPGILLTPLQGS